MKNSSLPPSSRSSLPISSGSEHFFGRKGRGLIPALVAGTLISCGGGPTEENNNPVNSIPLQASALVELGPITGASVQFTTLSGSSLATGGTNSDGSLNYNPRDIVSRMGNDQWIIVRVSGGSDIDADDDGVVDTTWTPVNGSFRVLLPRSFLETGERIIINPRAGVISEALLNRQSPNLSLSALDTIARESGGSDVNGDGKVSYRDIVSIQMKNVTDVSKVVPAASGYIQSVHNGNETTKATSLKNIVKTENHILAEIVPDTDTNSHNPMLHLKSVSSGATILYTLDGSSPLPNSGTTSRATGEVYIPLQNKKVYYREQFVMSGETVLGRVKGFDLLEDWIELAQTEQTYNTIGREGYISNSYSYKGQNYLINVWTNKISPGYTYPKLIDCQVGISSNDGCQYGPYIAYNENHEQRIRALIDTAVKSYIDTNVQTPINPDSPSETIANNVSYNGGYYSIFNEWTINTTTGKRAYPVRVWGRYTSKSGTTGTTEGGTATNDTTRSSLNQSIVTTLKTNIDKNTTTPPSHTQNQLTSYSGKIDNYYGGWYEVLNQWNLSGTADFPVSIIGTYATPTGGRMSNLTATAANESERITKSNQMVSQIQSAIVASYNSLPKPTYPQNYVINSGFISYRGYGYTLITTMNITGNSDYPSTVYATYTTPSGTRQTQTLTANSSTELAQIQTERANQAKALIDNALSTDQYAPNYVETVTSARSYATGSYRTTFTYSGNVGQDYPGYVDVYYTRGNGTSAKWTIQATNANEKNTYIPLGENQAKLEIDNYPLYSPNTITNSGVISYGTHGSNYTIYAKYNRVGTGYNYPALVWIEYRSGTNGTLQSTQNTYGVMEAKSSEQKEQIKAQLESWVRGQIMAAAPATTQFAESIKWNIGDILISNAHAQTLPSITIGKSVSKVTPYAPYSGNYLFGQSYYSGFGVQNIYTKWASGATNTSAKALDAIPLKDTIKTISLSAEKISDIYLDPNSGSRCTGAGLTYDSCLTDSQLQGALKKIFDKVVECKNANGGKMCIFTDDLNKAVTNSMEMYLDTNNFYFGGSSSEVESLVLSGLQSISKGETPEYYITQLRSYGVSEENLKYLQYISTYYGMKGYGTTEIYPENYVYGAKALFGLGRIGVTMLVEQATGKVLAQAITGPGAAEFLKYESRVISGKVIFRDATGNMIRLEKGTNAWGFDHIFKSNRDLIQGNTRIIQLINSSEVKSFMQRTLGKSTIESFDDFEKFVGYAIRNGVSKGTTNGKAEYVIENVYRIVIDKASGRILTISF